jgi:hypothetical protein
MSENEVKYRVRVDKDGYVKGLRIEDVADAASEDAPWSGMTAEEAYHAGFSAGLDS